MYLRFQKDSAYTQYLDMIRENKNQAVEIFGVVQLLAGLTHNDCRAWLRENRLSGTTTNLLKQVKLGHERTLG